MNAKELCSMVDHTLLKQTATWPEIQNLCDEAIAYGTASVCIPPCYVAQAHQYVQGKMTICTVVGFPNGNTTPASKEFETREALANGAEEIDMVINIGMLKAGDLSYVADEIRRLKAAVGDKVLKVIIETCLLTDEEKIAMCKVVTDTGADFIKTSTGFSTAGATFADIELFAKHVGPGVKIKAAGGISTPQAYARYDRIGTDVRPDSAAAAAAIARGDLAGLCAQMKNALEYSSASAATKPICETLRAHGALAALMTGSGAAVFGVFADEAPAQAAKAALLRVYPQCWVLRPEAKGARVVGRG